MQHTSTEADMLRLLNAVLGVCDMANPDSAYFADSAVDCLQELLLHEAEIRAVAAKAEAEQAAAARSRKNRRFPSFLTGLRR